MTGNTFSDFYPRNVENKLLKKCAVFYLIQIRKIIPVMKQPVRLMFVEMYCAKFFWSLR